MRQTDYYQLHADETTLLFSCSLHAGVAIEAEGEESSRSVTHCHTPPAIMPILIHHMEKPMNTRTATTLNLTVNINIQDLVTVAQLQDQSMVKAASQIFRRHRIAQKIAALGGQDLANQYMAGAL